MRDIGYKFLSGFIKCAHSAEYLIECIHHVFCFQIIIDRSRCAAESRLNVLNLPCELFERPDQLSRKQKTERKNKEQKDHFKELGRTVENVDRRIDGVRGNACQNDAVNGLLFLFASRGIITAFQ